MQVLHKSWAQSLFPEEPNLEHRNTCLFFQIIDTTHPSDENQFIISLYYKERLGNSKLKR